MSNTIHHLALWLGAEREVCGSLTARVSFPGAGREALARSVPLVVFVTSEGLVAAAGGAGAIGAGAAGASSDKDSCAGGDTSIGLGWRVVCDGYGTFCATNAMLTYKYMNQFAPLY